jgi:hypothetical protein
LLEGTRVWRETKLIGYFRFLCWEREKNKINGDKNVMPLENKLTGH